MGGIRRLVERTVEADGRDCGASLGVSPCVAGVLDPESASSHSWTMCS